MKRIWVLILIGLCAIEFPGILIVAILERLGIVYTAVLS